MDLQLFIRTNKELFSKLTRDGLLVLSPDEKDIYILKGTGSLIWDKANGKKTAKEIIEFISQKFEIDFNIVEKDTLTFLKEVVREAPSLFIFSKTPIRT